MFSKISQNTSPEIQKYHTKSKQSQKSNKYKNGLFGSDTAAFLFRPRSVWWRAGSGQRCVSIILGSPRMRFNVSRFPGCPSRQMGLWTDLSAARRLSSLMKMLIVRPKTVTGFKNHEGNMREHGGNNIGQMFWWCLDNIWTIFEQCLNNIWTIFILLYLYVYIYIYIYISYFLPLDWRRGWRGGNY